MDKCSRDRCTSSGAKTPICQPSRRPPSAAHQPSLLARLCSAQPPAASSLHNRRFPPQPRASSTAILLRLSPPSASPVTCCRLPSYSHAASHHSRSARRPPRFSSNPTNHRPLPLVIVVRRLPPLKHPVPSVTAPKASYRGSPNRSPSPTPFSPVAVRRCAHLRRLDRFQLTHYQIRSSQQLPLGQNFSIFITAHQVFSILFTS